ncbi:MAG: FAD/NAD(P)-binding protein, partial [Brachybacterium sp.]|nr:FAD/NAD(P)-binding protein [Brachybacterium sp.]
MANLPAPSIHTPSYPHVSGESEMTSVDGASPVRLVLVGAGPRGLGILERLAANAADHPELLTGRRLQIDLVDPHMPGAGRIWRADGHELLLMNSRAADVTMFTDDSVAMDGPVREGPTLAEWAEGIRRGSIDAPTAGTERLREIHDLPPTTFAS